MRVVERLTTLCGETHLAGVACALIRFAGCDLRCRWCDTTYAREAEGQEITAAELERWVDRTGLGLVLLTGGEPLLQAGLAELATRLAERRTVLVETSGAHDIRPLAAPIVRSVDIKCPASGEAERNLWQNLDHLRPGDAVKLVIADRADYDFARDVIARHRLELPVHVLLSPVGHRAAPLDVARELAGWILEDRLHGVRLNLQLHRLLWPEGEEAATTTRRRRA
jgi:7-carboxy-7-deazaguanine synthase